MRWFAIVSRSFANRRAARTPTDAPARHTPAIRISSNITPRRRLRTKGNCRHFEAGVLGVGYWVFGFGVSELKSVEAPDSGLLRASLTCSTQQPNTQHPIPNTH